MKDFLGNDLNVGDLVVMVRPNYRNGGHLTTGRIDRFTPKMAVVVYDGRSRWGGPSRTLSCMCPAEKMVRHGPKAD